VNFDFVKKILIELGVDEDVITLDSSFADDFLLDELDFVELLMAIEEEFNLDLEENYAEEHFILVKDLVNYLDSQAR